MQTVFRFLLLGCWSLLIGAGCDTTRDDPGHPPTAPQVRITPDTPLAGEALGASIWLESTDEDGDDLVYQWHWQKNGVDLTYTGPDIPHLVTEKGETWRVLVTAFDGTHTGPAGTDEVAIGVAPGDDDDDAADDDTGDDDTS